MLISIILPLYNCETYLRETLDSVYQNILNADVECEVILVNDGSTDNTQNIIECYQEKYPRLTKVLCEENQGLYKARLIGIENAAGEYIMFCDGDDILSNNALIEISSVIKKYHPDVAFYDITVFDNKKTFKLYENEFGEEKLKQLKKATVLEKFFTDINYFAISMCGKCCKRSLFDLDKLKTIHLTKNHAEDTLLSIYVYENSENFIFINEALYFYRSNSGMTSRYNHDYLSSHLKVINETNNLNYLKEYQNIHIWTDIRRANTLSRAITLLRKTNSSDDKQKIQILKQLFSYNDIINLHKNFLIIRKRLEKKYEVLLSLGFRGKFKSILMLLKIKNIISKN